MPRDLNHIVLTGYTSTLSFTSPRVGRDKVRPIARDRISHGNSIKSQFDLAVLEFIERPDLDFIYLEFESEKNCLLAFDSFEDGRGGDYKFVSSKKNIQVIDGEESSVYKACVYLNKRGVSKFLQKIEQYLHEDTVTGNPRNKKLINNIEAIRTATLKTFWQEIEIEFPENNDFVWWEVWFRRDDFESDMNEENAVLGEFSNEIEVAERRLLFPEHIVRMIKATVEQLSNVLLNSDKLSELRSPKVAAEFFINLNQRDTDEWIEDFKSRIDDRTNDNSVIICILDTGVNRSHPLLQDFIPERNMDTIKTAWGTGDSGAQQGHGTLMAGTSLYGDLTEPLANAERIEIHHTLESIKLIHIHDPHKPEFYGVVTEEAVAKSIILNPFNNRVYVMAVTAKDGSDRGKPSSWSSSIDLICFKSEDETENKSLFCISSGNVIINNVSDYPSKNILTSIHDPAQAFNALTIGSYTEKNTINQLNYLGSLPLVNMGGMSPTNSTSLTWENNWAIKPEIVLEGGNLAIFNNSLNDPSSLRMLSTGKDVLDDPLVTFGDTSGATALGARFSARLMAEYPILWAESIKGLIVHSSYWTSEMLNRRNIIDFNKIEKINLLRTVGYGVPNFEDAIKSANNSLTIIAQRSLRPYKLEEGRVKTNEMHLFELPWPEDALSSLFDSEVTLTITLSYFIEPNPGNKQYSSSYFYQSHGLRFSMINSGETLAHFRERVNREERREGNEEVYGGGENWLIGSQVRDKGSIHKDIWKGTGADLSTKNVIAIYPVNGWWKTRKKLRKYDNNIRYSLIVNIDSSENDIDLYTPILNAIDVLV